MIVEPPGSAAGAGCAVAAGRGEPLPRRKPHEPQNRLEVVLTWLHCGHTTTPAPGAAAACAGAASGATGAGCGAGAREGIIAGPAATATVPARPVAALAATCAARTPCGGVWGENGFGAASRGSSAPHPRQNL